MKAEELVRKAWGDVFTLTKLRSTVGVADVEGVRCGPYYFSCYARAATYTRAHLEKVRWKREEIGVVKAAQTVAEVEGCSVERITWARILSMLEAQLAELESGLTDWAKANVEELLKEH